MIEEATISNLLWTWSGPVALLLSKFWIILLTSETDFVFDSHLTAYLLQEHIISNYLNVISNYVQKIVNVCHSCCFQWFTCVRST